MTDYRCHQGCFAQEQGELPSSVRLDFQAQSDDGQMYLGHLECLGFFDVSVTKLTTGQLIDGSPCGEIDMVINYLDLEPKIDAMTRDFWDFTVLPGGKNLARKRVVRSSHVEMDPAGRRSSKLLA
ncbi:hypothetical protein Tco_0233726 [Tanacetum coccineum]